jgi:hypothetical protein
VIGYQVELCELGQSNWGPATAKVCEHNEFRLDGLGTDRDLQFRIIAINAAGRSAPSDSSRPVRPSESLAHPLFYYRCTHLSP